MSMMTSAVMVPHSITTAPASFYQLVANSHCLGKDYSKPLYVDCSVEYELPSSAKPPPGAKNEPLLMIHPAYYRKTESQKRTPFVNNLGASSNSSASLDIRNSHNRSAKCCGDSFLMPPPQTAGKRFEPTLPKDANNPNLWRESVIQKSPACGTTANECGIMMHNDRENDAISDMSMTTSKSRSKSKSQQVITPASDCYFFGAVKSAISDNVIATSSSSSSICDINFSNIGSVTSNVGPANSYSTRNSHSQIKDNNSIINGNGAAILETSTRKPDNSALRDSFGTQNQKQQPAVGIAAVASRCTGCRQGSCVFPQTSATAASFHHQAATPAPALNFLQPWQLPGGVGDVNKTTSHVPESNESSPVSKRSASSTHRNTKRSKVSSYTRYQQQQQQQQQSMQGNQFCPFPWTPCYPAASSLAAIVSAVAADCSCRTCQQQKTSWNYPLHCRAASGNLPSNVVWNNENMLRLFQV